MFVYAHLGFFTLRQTGDFDFHLLGIGFEPAQGRLGGRGDDVGKIFEVFGFFGTGADFEDVAWVQANRRNVDAATVEGKVAVGDELASLATSGRKTSAIDGVVGAALKELKKVFAGQTFGTLGLGHEFGELFLEETVETANLLLLAKLGEVEATATNAHIGVLTGDAGLFGHDFVSLGRKSVAFATRLFDNRRFIAGHYGFLSPLGRTPPCAIGVKSVIESMRMPAAEMARMALSRPRPIPLT